VSFNKQGTAQAAGFYAAAYTLTEAVGDLAAGSTVISYRGTGARVPSKGVRLFANTR